MSDEPVRIEREGAIAIVTLNNPARRNALSIAMRDGLTAAMIALGNDPECRAIVLTGAGGNFCAGGDFQDFPKTSVYAARGRLEQGSATLMRFMVSGRVPIVAAVEGHCVGAGLSFAAASDQVVMSRTARLRCAFISAGLMPDLAGLWSLPRRVGMGQAKRLAMLGQEISAEEALRIGLADTLVAPGEALETARLLAHELAGQPPLAIAMIKSVLALDLDAVLKSEIDLQTVLMVSEDHREAVRAFLEKRPAKFEGR